jgi:glycosyltransferase involved in cell wall biosynthesis
MHKKLLILIPSLSSGGAERQMLKLLEFLNEKDCVPTVVTYTERPDYPHSLNINRINIVEKSRAKRFFKIFMTITKEKPDVMLTYGANTLLILLSFFYRKSKVVVSGRHSPPKYNFATWCTLNLFRFADAIILNSFSQTEFIRKYTPFLTSKLTTIINYTDVMQLPFNIKQRGEVLKIGILARYHPQKNIIRFLETIKELNKKYPKQIEYYWYGQNYFDCNGNPTKFSQYYLKCENFRQKEVLNNVFFYNFSDNVQSVMQKMDVICLPSLYEGFSNTLSEAICAGKPILASDVADNRSFVKNGENGFLFNPLNIANIVSAFDKLMALSKDELIVFQKNSRRIAEQLFSKERFIQSNLEVLFN